MLVDIKAIENEFAINIVDVLEKDFRVPRTVAILKYNLKTVFLSRK